nr:immunoglobulin heavy chain junction region [Macaca mulatta]MOX04473.1 immunoglobulin heavy chain junction region [Macaca mulatta]MOX05433.1 immunoglobulin heavy chain junction region [Macaca mulatta]MOX05474.1 immunoglobulin heavy chain junction region [Macaca mulatta]
CALWDFGEVNGENRFDVW